MPKTRPCNREGAVMLTSLTAYRSINGTYKVRCPSRGFHLELHRRQIRRSDADNLHKPLDIHRRTDAQNIGNGIAERSSRHGRNRHDQSQAVLDVVASDNHREVVQKTEANKRQ